MSARIPSSFEPAADATPAAWIVGAVRPWERDRVRLWSFMPEGFEAYARVLHPAHPSSGPGGSVTWRELAAGTGVEIGPTTGFREVVETDLSDPQGLDVHEPSEGSIAPELLSALARSLSDFTETPDRVWVAVWEGWGSWYPHSRGTLTAFGPDETISDASPPPDDTLQIDPETLPRFEIPNRAYYLLSAKLTDVAGLQIEGWDQSPSLWWPDDRAWCVATEVDGYSTYVGGRRSCIAAVIASDEVEALEVPIDVPFDPGPYRNGAG